MRDGDIKSWASATERGVDIGAEQGGQDLLVEATGGGSSKTGGPRFGNLFIRNTVTNHVPRAIYMALHALAGNAEAAIVFPDSPRHRATVSSAQPVLSNLGSLVFWAD